AELLELLGLLERRGWQAMERLERRARVGVEADVLEAGDAAGIAVVGDRVLREVERVAVGGAGDLVHGRVVRLLRAGADLAGRLPDVDDQGLARDVAQHLARQARGAEARGDDAEGREAPTHEPSLTERHVACGGARPARRAARTARSPAASARRGRTR